MSFQAVWADLARGSGLGLAVAAPIGPTALLCIQRTLVCGVGTGLATGYAAATVHAFYAASAAVGLTVLVAGVAGWAVPLQVCSALFLLHVAVGAARRPVDMGGARQRRRLRPWGAYVSGLAWTLGNPLTLVGYVTLTPVILGPGEHGWGDLPPFTAGVLLGSAGWWTVVACGVGLARRVLTEGVLRWANRGMAVVLGTAAVSLLVNVAWRQERVGGLRQLAAAVFGG